MCSKLDWTEEQEEQEEIKIEEPSQEQNEENKHTIDKQRTYQGHSVNAKCKHHGKEMRRQVCIE